MSPEKQEVQYGGEDISTRVGEGNLYGMNPPVGTSISTAPSISEINGKVEEFRSKNPGGTRESKNDGLSTTGGWRNLAGKYIE